MAGSRGQRGEGGRAGDGALLTPCSRCLRAEAAASLEFIREGRSLGFAARGRRG